MATYYVRSVGGSDSASGLSFANGWATIAYAVANSTTSDTIYVCSSQSNPFDITATIVTQYNQNWIGGDLLTGAAYNGVGKAWIQSGAILSVMLTTDRFVNYKDICFSGVGNGSTTNILAITATSTSYTFNEFENCDFIYALADGVYLDWRVHWAPPKFIGCNFRNNGAAGVYLNQSSSSAVIVSTFFNCAMYDNTTYGIRIIGQSTTYPTYTDVYLTQCRIFRNGSHGLYSVNCMINSQNSIYYANIGSGLNISTSCMLNNFYNNILSGNGVYAIDGTSSLLTYRKTIFGVDYNCYYNNTSGDVPVTFNGGVIPGSNNIEADPLFVNNGSALVSGEPEDFRLRTGSPCISSGIGFEGGQ